MNLIYLDTNDVINIMKFILITIKITKLFCICLYLPVWNLWLVHRLLYLFILTPKENNSFRKMSRLFHVLKLKDYSSKQRKHISCLNCQLQLTSRKAGMGN